MLNARDIEEAKENSVLARLERAEIDAEGHVTGYVVDATEELIFLSQVSDLIRFDGFSVLRKEDVSSIEVPAPHGEFIEAALKLRGEEVTPAPPISLDSMKDVLITASAAFPLVTIHKEFADPDHCWIGKVVRATDEEVSMLEISPDAEWDDEPSMHKIEEITSVDFGGQYEDALSAVNESKK